MTGTNASPMKPESGSSSSALPARPAANGVETEAGRRWTADELARHMRMLRDAGVRPFDR